ncbi:hypothetical protein Chor_001915 [Crotalus horridus]
MQHALEEKQLMESVLLNCREDLQLATNKGSGFKEVKILKKLAEVKATERSLRIRVKNLTNELALYKKGLNRTGVTKRDGHRSASGERSNSQDRSVPWGASRQRSSSRDGRSGSQGRISRQSPSPTGIRAPRFDPTAFVKAKERKQKEVEQKNKNQHSDNRAGLLYAVSDTGTEKATIPFPVFLSSKRNLHRAMGDTPPSGCKRTSASSGSEMEDYSEPVAPRGRKRLGRNRKAFSSSSWNGPTVVSDPPRFLFPKLALG